MARPHQRRWNIAAGVAGLLLGLPALAIVLLLNYDWNQARPWLDARTSEALGRPFAIAGTLVLSWERPAWHSWRDLLPWPHLVARDIHIGNPPGLPQHEMASLRQLAFTLNPLALLEHRIEIPLLQFERPSVALERSADGKENWSIEPRKSAQPWRLDLERVVFSKGEVQLNDALSGTVLQAELDTIEGDPRYGVRWSAHGSYHGVAASGSGKAGSVLSLKQQRTPFPLQAALHVGSTRITLEGTLTRPSALAALDLQLALSGVSMAHLYGLTGVLLPETPPFHTAGHLSASLDGQHKLLVYDHFSGKVGASDIGGHVEYQTGTPRGKLSGKVSSQLLQFADLGPLVGADSNASKAARGAPPVQPANKVLPVEPFRTERWTSVDADVQFAAARVVREHQLPISQLSTHVLLKDGVLTLDPLRFQIAGGELQSSVQLDGSARSGQHTILAKASVSARHLRLRQLFPTLDGLQATVGEINGDARLSASGDSPASLLAHADGELKTLIDRGQVSKLLLEEMGLNIGSVVLTKLFGDRQVRLNCMATDFLVTDGLMQTRSFVVDTDEATITAGGTVNLANERLDLVLRPETKSLRLVSLRSPLYVRGSFSDPQVSVDKGVLALRAGGALALAVLAAPAAALLPLVNSGPGKDSPCAQLLAEARQRPQAPAPR
ncbi:MAG: AsmA family protein [Pseudomonadota bacterium]